MGFAPKFGFWFAWWLTLALVGIYTTASLPTPLSWISVGFGIFLLFYGLLLNAIAGRTLKEYGHFELTKGVKRPDRLVTTGLYSCMRHPAQFGSIFFGMGIAFVTSNIYAILLSGWYAFSAIYFILSIEERESIKNFGADYYTFIKNRKPFTFSLSCLKRGLQALKNTKL